MNNMMRIGVSFSFLLLFLFPIKAQESYQWGLSTNLASDILLSPNLKVEKYLKNHYVISAGGSYGWWGFDWNTKKAFQQWHAAIDINRYMQYDSMYTGHRIGIGLESGQYDRKKNDDAKRGHFATAGLLYGYTWKLNRNFYLDAGIGLGYIYKYYHKYTYCEVNDCYCCTEHKAKHLFGLTSLNISITYRFLQKR